MKIKLANLARFTNPVKRTSTCLGRELALALRELYRQGPEPYAESEDEVAGNRRSTVWPNWSPKPGLCGNSFPTRGGQGVSRPPLPQAMPLPDHVHVHYFPLTGDRTQLARCEAVLSAPEWTRVRRLQDPEAARRFVVRRGTLRHLLAEHLGMPPQAVPIVRDAWGKPGLAPPAADAGLHFNLADSDDLAVYALAWGHPVGVDLERIRPMPAAEAMAARYFSPQERDWFLARPIDQRDEAFLRCWTCKEALVKAVGVGLSVPLADLTVAHWEDPPRIVWPNRPGRWQVYLLPAPPGYLAALVIASGTGHMEEEK